MVSSMSRFLTLLPKKTETKFSAHLYSLHHCLTQKIERITLSLRKRCPPSSDSWHHLDREGHKAVVLTDVSLENVRARTQNSLEPRPVELDALERPHGGDGGGPGSVQHQGDLPEVVRGPQDPDLLALLPFVPELGHWSVAIHNDEEVIPGLSLSHNIRTVLEGGGLKSVSYCQSFPFVKIF